MKIKNINSVFYSRLGLVFKIIIYILILLFVTSIISFAIITPISKDLRKGIAEVGLADSFVEYLQASINGTNVDGARANLLEAVTKIDDVMSTWSGEVAGTIIVFIIFMFLYGILYFMAYYPISDIINHFMSSNSKYGFAANYIANAKKSFKFSIIYLLYTMVVYVIGFAIAIGLGILIGKLNAILGLFVMAFLSIGTLALRRAIVPYWIPAMVSKGLSVYDGFAKNMELIKGNFFRHLGEYFVIYTISIVIVVISTFVTFGVSLIITYAGVWLYIQVKDLVEYYHTTGMKYYIDEQTVINPNKVYRDAILDEENFTL